MALRTTERRVTRSGVRAIGRRTSDIWLKFAVIACVILMNILFVASMYAYFSAPHSSINSTSGLSDTTIASVHNMVDADSNIVGVQIVAIDLQQNTRFMRYTYIANVNALKLYDAHLRSTISNRYPVFTADDKNNLRITQLMNHEFVCTAYTETMSYKIVPESGEYVKHICSVSTPPSFGDFNGIVAVLLAREPTLAELELIKVLLRKLSNQVDIDTM